MICVFTILTRISSTTLVYLSFSISLFLGLFKLLMIIRRSYSQLPCGILDFTYLFDLLCLYCSKGFFLLRMCDFIVDIKESQCKKRFCFLRRLLPLLSPISCIPIMFSNYLLMWLQPLRFFFCRFLSVYTAVLSA